MAKQVKLKRFRDGKWWADYYCEDLDPQVNVGIEDGEFHRGEIFLPGEMDFLLDMHKQRKLGKLLAWWEKNRRSPARSADG